MDGQNILLVEASVQDVKQLVKKIYEMFWLLSHAYISVKACKHCYLSVCTALVQGVKSANL